MNRNMSSNMKTGSHKQSTSLCTNQMQQLCKKNEICSDNNVKHTNHQGVQTDVQESLQAPIFNIHIHVPLRKGDTTKMFLPKIQPVIHLHFDELARKLGINRDEVNQEDKFTAFQNLLVMTTPKFGSVKFHYQNKSNETVNKEQETDRMSSCSSENGSNDNSVNLDMISETESIISHSVLDYCGSCNSCADCNQRNNINQSNKCSEEAIKLDLYKEYKLKDAVVMLTDVRRTQYYKRMVAAGYFRDSVESHDNKNEYSNSEEKLDNPWQGVDNFQGTEECVIKKEAECNSPESKSLERRTEEMKICNPKCNVLCTAISSMNNDEFLNDVMGDQDKTLSSLAEGCNFSEILNRFQIKNCKDSVKCSETNLDISYMLKNEEDCNYASDEKIPDQSGSSDKLIAGGVNLGERDSTCGSTVNNTVIDNKSHFEECADSVVTSDDIAYQCLSNKCNNFESDSDDADITSDKLAISEEHSSNPEVVFSSLKASRSLHMSDLKLFETRGSKLINSGIAGLQLELIQKEVMTTQLQNGKNEKKRKDSKSKSTDEKSSLLNLSSPPKKTKHSDDSTKKSPFKTRTSSVTEDYIPLQASGPTKFAVAPLNKVNPYESHSARNFKKEMLFGNRVNRFSSPIYFRVYQLKRKAAKNQPN